LTARLIQGEMKLTPVLRSGLKLEKSRSVQ
jgi:hypothetical protein